MTPTPEELLRLARKAWPDSERIVVGVDDEKDRDPYVEIYGEHGGYKSIEVCMHDRAQQALHAALLVLAGELDVVTLLAELDKLREEVAKANRVVYSMITGTEDL